MTTETIAQETKTDKAQTLCAKCGEPAGSISAGTGFPLVSDRNGNRADRVHVKCATVAPVSASLLAGVL